MGQLRREQWQARELSLTIRFNDFTETGAGHRFQHAQFQNSVINATLEGLFRDVMSGNFQMYTDMAYALRERGIDVEPDAREPLFVSSAHTVADIDNTLDRFNDAIKTCKPHWVL